MFSNLTVTQKGLILLLVPVIFEVGFFAYLSANLQDNDAKLKQLQTQKLVLLKLHEFETLVARGIMLLSNPLEQSREELLPRLQQLKNVFLQGDTWEDLKQIDPELGDIIEESVTMRKSMLKYLDETEKIIYKRTEPSNIKPGKIPTSTPTRQVMGIVFTSHELTQKVVRAESKIMQSEPKELREIRTKTTGTILLGLLFGTIMTIALALLFTRDFLQRLKIIAEKAHLVAFGRPLPPRQEGRDEIAMLDKVLHETSEVLAETRRKEVAILDNAADVICSLDERLRFTGISATVDKIWNYSQDQLLGSPLASLIPKNMQADTVSEFERIARGTHSGELENVIRCRDGSLKTFSWTINWSSKDKTFFCVAHDITERRAVEKLKQQFLSMVSHDLRAPVTATSLSVNLLIEGKRGELPEKIVTVLERTETSIGRLMELVNDLLELDKLEAGKLVLNRTAISAYEVCSAAKEALEAMAANAHVNIEGPSGDAAIYGDELRLIQAVTNLLSNAIKFSPKEGAVILSIARQGKFIELRITDQGPGIEREDAALIFEKFRQSRTAKQTTVKSTGLGLAIVKAIAEAHGGEVGVDSEPGKGSTFWIRLPEDTEGVAP